MATVGKREFTLYTSKYLKQVEESGEELTITHQNEPSLKLSPVQKKSIQDLSGTLTHCEVEGDINDPILPGYDEW
jgi:antitoxin (DNA-binding transcriptional repressor) of toxin-antitoxin stability system